MVKKIDAYDGYPEEGFAWHLGAISGFRDGTSVELGGSGQGITCTIRTI